MNLSCFEREKSSNRVFQHLVDFRREDRVQPILARATTSRSAHSVSTSWRQNRDLLHENHLHISTGIVSCLIGVAVVLNERQTAFHAAPASP